ncbi:predicted protein [Sclerotinia sclerotiorum 1980 UF-70]|uniref:Uncharacterized protein n=1 Tax=Sclerotinia sclerotiorum (strain ATCC 18683 / 1980 / Ss-1) TaxID=665079 RepID=A7F184_SCLS1|nr:predicted protein [Sclerotinia sclerotiorum 1980 UF-70]EDN95476.1 predicted protein [Sclerotinia sclerotiorum 1980 UF-70]
MAPEPFSQGCVFTLFHKFALPNELRAIDALPLEPRKNLNDTSPNGQKIYNLLKAFEKNGFVEGLEEAGRLLWAQVFGEPDFSQMPRKEPTSITGDIATSEYAEVRYTASQRRASQPEEKPAQLSAAEKVLSINTTLNSFFGSRKSWMTKGVSVSPSPRRASISSTENDKNNELPNSDFQLQSTPPIPFHPAQSRQQTQNHASIFLNQVPGASPNTFSNGVYTPWPLHSNYQEHQYASPYSMQVPTNSMSSVLERKDQARSPISCLNYTSNELNEYNPAMVNSYDPAKSHYFATLGSDRRDPNTLSYSAPRHLPSGYPNHTMACSGGTPYDPSTPPFHLAISSQVQALFYSHKKEEKHEVDRITSNIHQSLRNLPDSHGNQQVTSSSGVAAANSPANMADINLTSQTITPNASTYESPYSVTSSMTPEESSRNPFFIRDGMGFIHSQDLTYQGPDSISINPQPATSGKSSTSSFTNTNPTATVPKPSQRTSKKPGLLFQTPLAHNLEN